MTANTPLYCPCGNRLGVRRSDGAFLSRFKGRQLIIDDCFSTKTPGDWPVAHMTCEDCGRTTDVDNLLESAVA